MKSHAKSKQLHRQRYLPRFLVVMVVIGLLASTALYALAKPLPVLAMTSQLPVVPVATSAALQWPSFGQAAVGAVGYGVLATKGPQTALPTASIIKVMTALAVLRQKPLAVGEQGPLVTLDQTDVDYYTNFVAQDGSVVPVTAGEQISEYQMLQALLLPSANNIADSLARWSFGSVEAYNAYANAYAKQLGLRSMVVTDPSGLAATTVASPSDLVTLGEIALSNPVIAEIVAQTTATIPVAGQIYNVNAVLGRSGTIGIKTGNNDADLGAYLFATKQTVGDTTVTIVGAIMDGPSLPAALQASLPLIDSAAQNFSQRTIVAAGTRVGWYDVPWQGRVAVVTEKPITELLWSGQSSKITSASSAFHGAVARNQLVGSLLVQTSGGAAQKSTTNLRLSQAIQKPSIIWRLRHILN